MSWRLNHMLSLLLLTGLVSLSDRAWSDEPSIAVTESRQNLAPSNATSKDDDSASLQAELDRPAKKPDPSFTTKTDASKTETSELLKDGPGEIPAPVDWSTRYHSREVHHPQTPGAFDIVGSQIGADDPNRPRYPYKATEPWMAQMADPESWGDLAELPFVQLGWFANVDTSVYAPKVYGQFKSDTLLNGTFPGDPINLGVSQLDVNVSPRFELGYRYERGLGETRFGYQFYDFRGNDTLANYDQGAAAQQRSQVTGHVFDLDFCEFEFNPGGLPLIHPLFKFPGRTGLGRPLTAQLTPPPIEMRFLIGGRGANYFTRTEAVGPTTTDQVTSNFWGGGLHFTWDLNQRLTCDSPFYLHLRAEGSGTFGRIDQVFSRTRGADSETATDPQSWIGVPTVSVEIGLAWAPQLPDRTTRVTLAYHYEEWFSYGQATASSTDLLMNGILLRGEWKF